MPKIQNNAMNQAKRHESAKQSAAARLASGNKINSAADGAAELSVATKMTSAARSIAAATSNATRAMTLGQTIDKSLAAIQNEVMRIKELAVNASSDTFDTGDREKAKDEVDSRLANINNISDRTRYGNTQLLDGSTAVFKFQVAEQAGDLNELTQAKVDTAELGIDAIDITTIDNAQTAIGALDAAMNTLNASRAKVGAFTGSLDTIINANMAKSENILEAVDVLTKADIAEEATKLAMAEIASQLAQTMIAKENQSNAQNIPGLVR